MATTAQQITITERAATKVRAFMQEEGAGVDYVDGLQGTGFQIDNPNVVAGCGCGSSFQVKDDDADPAADAGDGCSTCGSH